MDFQNFLDEFFVRPILMHEGYNPVNTVVYALIAIVSAYLIYKLFRSIDVKFNREFMVRVIPFILLGSTVRVVTDCVDNGVIKNYEGVFKPVYETILESHLYDYGFITASPGIYVVVGLLTVVLMYYSYKTRNYDFGSRVAMVLFILHLSILIPLMENLAIGIMILAAASVITYVYKYFFSKSNVALHWLVVFSQALDGAATFFTIDVFNKMYGGNYFEQHVFANMLANIFNGSMLPFLIVKVLLAVLVVRVLENEKDENERNFIALLVIIFGLAPGVRDMLRVVCGA